MIKRTYTPIAVAYKKGKYGKKKEETKFEHFQHEISEAFDHFKKAFSKPD